MIMLKQLGHFREVKAKSENRADRPGLSVFHHDAFGVPALLAFKCAPVVIRFLRLDPRQLHRGLTF